jgi:hypothetical protein
MSCAQVERLDSALNSGSLDLFRDTKDLALGMAMVDLLLDSPSSLLGELFVLKHCSIVSDDPRPFQRMSNLQNANSSRVRPYVSGYMK